MRTAALAVALGALCLARPSAAEVPEGRVVWTRKLPAGTASSPVFLASGELVLGARDGRLYALDATTGAVRWSVLLRGKRPPAALDGSPVVAPGGTLLIGSDDGTLYGVRERKRVLAVPFGDVVRATAAVGPDGSIAVGCRDDKVYLLSQKGQVRWAFPTGGDVDAVTCADANTILAGSDDGLLYAIDAAQGTQRWTVEVGAPVRGQPLARGRVWLFAGLDGVVRGVSPEGKLLWRFQASGPVAAPLTIGPEGRLYVASRGGQLAALDLEGKVLWRLAVPDHLEAAPAVGADRIAFGGNDRKLRVLSKDGVPLWQHTTAAPIHTRPLLSGKRVIYADLAGNVHAVEPP